MSAVRAAELELPTPSGHQQAPKAAVEFTPQADIDLSIQLLEGAGVELSRACRASALERNVRENLYL